MIFQLTKVLMFGCSNCQLFVQWESLYTDMIPLILETYPAFWHQNMLGSHWTDRIIHISKGLFVIFSGQWYGTLG